MADPAIFLIALKTARMEALCNFYSRLGFEFQEEKHGSGPTHFASESDGFVFEIYPLSADDGKSDAVVLGLTVRDLAERWDAVTEAAEVVSPLKTTRYGLRGVVRDPEGRRVELLDPEHREERDA